MLQPGAILSGKYRIDSVLGEGGMAVVYAVTHLRNSALLAVKVLHADSQLKTNIRARFAREGKVANSVKHPGVVLMIDDGVTEDGSPYLVMEHLNGFCLDDMGSRGIPLSAALNIAYQVLDVLRAAHAHGIIHRDIKPANLFVLRDGRVKVLDFGISRLHDGAEPFDSVATGSVMGTPFFMAPEQARADASEIDTRTDLFAVGATLFTLLSGQYLHIGEDARQVMMQAATHQARSLACVAPATPQAVIDLVAKAVAYDSAARWESAEAMQEAVRELHEAWYGPIRFEALGTFLLAREFRRRSHTKLTKSVSFRPCASGGFDATPLSTTLPAVAAVTRSRESFRPVSAPASNSEAPSSRISAEPSELAGWTGQVPAKVEPKPGATTRKTSRNARVAQIAVLAGVTGTAIFGFTHRQAPEPAVTVASSLASHPAPPKLVPPVALAATTTSAGALAAPAPSSPRSSLDSSAKPASSFKLPGTPPPRKPFARELSALAEKDLTLVALPGPNTP
ncbi:MAG TPA: protein kinase [Polyangiaceae bacterium]|nr:protein kinase [Polyangiaceae bacterium]